ncbi:hypothetical protein B0H13DRAFT_2269721 [Mycena leptocephala]|nr:hypothetical protein B0H13DRAFT_2269721 [Mycena leptocephala]
MATFNPTLPRGAPLGISGADTPTSDTFAAANGHLAFAVSASVASAIMLWEYATLLPEELRLYRKPVWGTIPPYGCTEAHARFLALRYGGILATLPVLFLSATQTNSCQAAASLSQVGVVVVVTSSALIFTCRTRLLWSNNRVLGVALGGMLIIMTGAWIALATQYRTIVGPDPLFGSSCRILPTVPWLPLGNAVFTAFLITTLILTLLKLQHHDARDSLVAYLIYRSNVLYLIGTALTAATALVIQALSPPASALAVSVGTLATAFTVAFGTRAFRNLMLAVALEAERAQEVPYPSSSPIISRASEKRFAHPSPVRPDALTPFVTTSRGNASTERLPPPRSTRPHVGTVTSSPTRANNIGTTRPHPTPSAHPAPYTTFPSPPNSYANESFLGSASLSNSPSSLSPLRRQPSPPTPTPNSYTNYSLRSASASSPSNSPPTLSPLRRGGLSQTHLPEPPKSGWSDS